MWAAAAGHGPVVQALIEQRRRHPRALQQRHDAAPVRGAATAICRASARCSAAGADVKEKRPDGATPLLVAVINGHEDLVDLLLDKGADPNVEGGSTELTVQGVRARPMELKYRKLTNNERDSEGVTTGQYLREAAAGRGARRQLAHQRPVHLGEDRPAARHQVAAGSRRGRQRPNQHGGAQVVGRAGIAGIWPARPRFSWRRNRPTSR